MHVVAVALAGRPDRAASAASAGVRKTAPLLGELQRRGAVGRSRTVARTRARTHLPADAPHHPDQPVAVGGRPGSSTGMKSMTSPTPPGVMNRVIRIAVSGKYSCLTTQSSLSAAIRKRPPRSRSSSEANTLGRVEAGAAEPVDGAVGGHQRRRLQVADQPVVGDRRVTIHQWSLLVGSMMRPVTTARGRARVPHRGCGTPLRGSQEAAPAR